MFIKILYPNLWTFCNSECRFTASIATRMRKLQKLPHQQGPSIVYNVSLVLASLFWSKFCTFIRHLQDCQWLVHQYCHVFSRIPSFSYKYFLLIKKQQPISCLLKCRRSTLENCLVKKPEKRNSDVSSCSLLCGVLNCPQCSQCGLSVTADGWNTLSKQLNHTIM